MKQGSPLLYGRKQKERLPYLGNNPTVTALCAYTSVCYLPFQCHCPQCILGIKCGRFIAYLLSSPDIPYHRDSSTSVSNPLSAIILTRPTTMFSFKFASLAVACASLAVIPVVRSAVIDVTVGGTGILKFDPEFVVRML